MDNLLKQLDFDIRAIEYLSVITARVTPHNIEVVRKEFKNDSDALLEEIFAVDEVRKSNKNGVILLTKVKRHNRRKKTA